MEERGEGEKKQQGGVSEGLDYEFFQKPREGYGFCSACYGMPLGDSEQV